ncbi:MULTISPECIES: adenylosuccinate lyase family protein [Providencia]|uniref:Adenylosuccinate lyase family protein n=1 Tax=Providencia hangzhouensis TaxID=3031799 RepID=A0ABY9Z9L4_9GAMM|nr:MULTISPECIES: adenylosuccinate lyase family protein [Providencia]MBN6367031.1 adenylosuccinate lyase family protein [Providencia rettgeri]MDH2376722.1 adenylosuccinate lyase family protein [Providencia rettgeri]QLI95609.1 adenylosuccinate lyase family protein [Providencia rettgeri]QLQ64978.1 adenylosuccinate lyase family protein [Providencia rettgeri]URR21179.1 adenylosuccinate lyase family protein [Providencia rettgeri]
MRALYDSKSKTIDDRGIKDLLSDEAKYSTWLMFESMLAQAQAELGFIPQSAADEIKEKAVIENIDFEEMSRIYQKIGHGFVPFLKVLVNACSEESGKYIHYGITTQNIQQSSQLYMMKTVHHKFMLLLGEIIENLADLAERTKHMVMPGRTHGRHAIPITYGYKVSVWISDFIDCYQRMKECEKRVFTIMMGGAVGAFNSMPSVGMAVQKRVAELVGMEAMEVPSRNLSTHKLEYMANLALMANICHKIGEEVYSTTLEEIAEVSEGFTKGTVGSSTMPHKINPKLAKGIIANSQKLYSLPSVGMYSAVRPYEGDSSSYMLFDGLIEEALELTTEILLRTEELSRTIVPHEERMLHNVLRNKGLDNTEYVMMKMAEKLGKDKAHSLLYEEAIKTAADGEDFYTNLTKNSVISAAFSNEEIKAMLDPRSYIGLSVEIAEKEAKRGLVVSQEIKQQYK